MKKKKKDLRTRILYIKLFDFILTMKRRRKKIYKEEDEEEKHKDSFISHLDDRILNLIVYLLSLKWIKQKRTFAFSFVCFHFRYFPFSQFFFLPIDICHLVLHFHSVTHNNFYAQSFSFYVFLRREKKRE